MPQATITARVDEHDKRDESISHTAVVITETNNKQKALTILVRAFCLSIFVEIPLEIESK